MYTYIFGLGKSSFTAYLQAVLCSCHLVTTPVHVTHKLTYINLQGGNAMRKLNKNHLMYTSSSRTVPSRRLHRYELKTWRRGQLYTSRLTVTFLQELVCSNSLSSTWPTFIPHAYYWHHTANTQIRFVFNRVDQHVNELQNRTLEINLIFLNTVEKYYLDDARSVTSFRIHQTAKRQLC